LSPQKDTKQNTHQARHEKKRPKKDYEERTGLYNPVFADNYLFFSGVPQEKNAHKNTTQKKKQKAYI